MVCDLADGFHAGDDGDGAGFADQAAGDALDSIAANPCQTRCYDGRNLRNRVAGIMCDTGGRDSIDAS